MDDEGCDAVHPRTSPSKGKAPLGLLDMRGRSREISRSAVISATCTPPRQL